MQKWNIYGTDILFMYGLFTLKHFYWLINNSWAQRGAGAPTVTFKVNDKNVKFVLIREWKDDLLAEVFYAKKLPNTSQHLIFDFKGAKSHISRNIVNLTEGLNPWLVWTSVSTVTQLNLRMCTLSLLPPHSFLLGHVSNSRKLLLAKRLKWLRDM